jgi:hypothetical protein
MADRAHDMRLSVIVIHGVAHGFSIDGQALVNSAILGSPGAECSIELLGIDPDQRIADHGDTRHFVNTLAFSATESTACLLAQ